MIPMKVKKLTTVTSERSVLTSNSINVPSLLCSRTKNLEVGHHGIHFGLALEFFNRCSDFSIGVRHTYFAQRSHVRRHAASIDRRIHQPRIGWHDGLGHEGARVG